MINSKYKGAGIASVHLRLFPSFLLTKRIHHSDTDGGGGGVSVGRKLQAFKFVIFCLMGEINIPQGGEGNVA